MRGYVTDLRDWVVANSGFLARSSFFMLQIGSLAATEMGLVRQLAIEVTCEMAADSDGYVSEHAASVIEYTGYAAWFVCVPLFVMSRFRTSWELTDMQLLRRNFITREQLSILTTAQKIKFWVFVSVLLLGHYALSALTKFLGVYYLLTGVGDLDRGLADTLAGVITFILATISFGFAVPDCLQSALRLVTSSQAPLSKRAHVALVLLGLGIAGGSIDYLIRFLKTKDCHVLDYIPLLVSAGMVEFLYPVLTSGSTIHQLPAIREHARSHPITAGLFGVSALCWLPMNAHQLASGGWQLAKDQQTVLEPHSSHIKDICESVVSNRPESAYVVALVLLLAAGVTLFSTVFFELYQFVKLLAIPAPQHHDEQSGTVQRNGHHY